jgi:hypothetical protein
MRAPQNFRHFLFVHTPVNTASFTQISFLLFLNNMAYHFTSRGELESACNWFRDQGFDLSVLLPLFKLAKFSVPASGKCVLNINSVIDASHILEFSLYNLINEEEPDLPPAIKRQIFRDIQDLILIMQSRQLEARTTSNIAHQSAAAQSTLGPRSSQRLAAKPRKVY